MNAKVAITPFSTSSDANLIVLLGRILDSMTGNANYPAPVPTLAALTAARTTFVSAVNALDRSKASTVRRNDARAAVVQMLRDMALYVQHTCGGDMAKLISSGFPAQQPRRQPIGVLLPPQNVTLRPARVSGQILARCKAVPQASAYQWRYASALTPTVWTQPDPVTTASFTLQNLTRGTDYIVQVRVLGAKGPSDWSDSATLMAA
jgi:hypothetical protein